MERTSKLNYKKIYAIEKSNRERLLKVNPKLDDKSGIYFLTRTDEDGISYFYIGQAVKIFMDNGTGKHQSNTVYDENALCPNITTVEGGGTQQIKVCESQIVAMRGRNPDNPLDRTVGSPTEQRLEVNIQGTSNCLTSVQKDNLLLEKPQYRIRKLTPRECGRLMGVPDEDIDKMAAVNSNTQLYKQFGNSIVVDVMCAMFKNLNIQ